MLEADINPLLFSYFHVSACCAASRKAWFLAKARSRASGLQVTVSPALPSFRDLNNFSRHRTAEKHPWCFHMMRPLLSPLLYLFIPRRWKEDCWGGFPGKGQRQSVLEKTAFLIFLLTTGMPGDPPNCSCYDFKGWLLGQCVVEAGKCIWWDFCCGEAQNCMVGTSSQCAPSSGVSGRSNQGMMWPSRWLSCWESWPSWLCLWFSKSVPASLEVPEAGMTPLFGLLLFLGEGHVLSLGRCTAYHWLALVCWPGASVQMCCEMCLTLKNLLQLTRGVAQWISPGGKKRGAVGQQHTPCLPHYNLALGKKTLAWFLLMLFQCLGDIYPGPAWLEHAEKQHEHFTLQNKKVFSYLATT